MTSAKARILVVDDDRKALDGLEKILVLHEFGVTVALGGQEALNRLAGERFDITLLDLRMPEVSGYDLLDHITAEHVDTTVIVISGEATFDAAAEVLRRGARDFIRKPYAVEQLLNSIEAAMNERGLRRENERMQERLRHSERLYRYMVDSSPDIIYVLDDQGRFVFLNRKFEDLLGYTRKEMLGRHYSVILHPDDVELVRYSFNERRTGARATNCQEIRIRRADESEPAHFEVTSISVELSAMGIYRPHPHVSEREWIGTYGVARDITRRKDAEQLIAYQAYHDLLTGLPNRARLAEHFGLAYAQVERGGHRLALMFIDLDRFKMVNDTMGHASGDELLRKVADRLRDCIRGSDTLARIGGDEFVLLLPYISERKEAGQTATKIFERLREPFDLGSDEVFVSASIGIAFAPDDGDELVEIMRKADTAMYRAKDRNDRGFVFFDESMDQALTGHLTLDSSLRRAVEERQFQPQVDARNGRMIGVEALVRWNHPTRGILPPIEFISHAEETGLIAAIGENVAHDACTGLAAWRRNGRDNFRVSINMSAPELERDESIETLLRILREYDIPGSNLEVEITENMLVRNIEHIADRIRRLAAHGISIAVDDFGVGYSSLSYLHKLPVDTLKIDRSFINLLGCDRRSQSIVRGIIVMANDLGIGLIAEGVETEEQRDRLLELGCPYMQGYLFSRPVSAEVLDNMLVGEAGSDVGRVAP